MALQQESPRELALFAGAGGGLLASELYLNWRTVCAVEYEPYRIERLLQRQEEQHLCPFPIWDDVTTFDGRPWRGQVDIISGGFPCQDVSISGTGDGLRGSRSGLWDHMARIIDEVRPGNVWIENSPQLIRRGLGRILCDLAAVGYDATWGVVSARDAGAPHLRKRAWVLGWLGDPEEKRLEGYSRNLKERCES